MFRVLTTLSIYLLMVNCSPKNSGVFEFESGGKSYKLKREETLVVNVGVFNPVLDWSQASLINTFIPIDNIMVGLTRYSFEGPTPEIKPALAESWTSSEDQKTWTFKLRKDARWSDNVPVTAQHFVDAIKRILDPKLGSRSAKSYFTIDQAEAYYKGEKPWSAVGFKKINDHSLQIQLNKGVRHLPRIVSFSNFFPIRRDVIEARPDDWYQDMSFPVVGPYKPLYINPEGEVFLQKNDLYYDQSERVPYIKFTNVENPSTSARLFQKGQFDVNLNISRDSTAITDEGLVSKPNFAIFILMFNIQRPPFDQQEYRALLNKAIDRKLLAKLLGDSYYERVSLCPDLSCKGQQFNYSPKPLTDADRELAKKLAGKPLKLYTFKIPECVTLVTSIQNQIQEKLGLNVEVEVLPHKQMLDKFSSGDYQMVASPFSAQLDTPYTVLELVSSRYTNWENPAYLKAMERGQASKTNAEELKWLAEAEAIFQGELPSIPLLTPSMRYQVKPKVKGLHTGPIKKLLFHSIKIEP